MWRAIVGVLLAPLSLIAQLLTISGKSVVSQVVGGLFLALLSPVWVGRLLRRREQLRALARSFAGTPLPRTVRNRGEQVLAAK